MRSLALVNGIVFLLLSLLHFYWALGGRRGLNVSLPERESGELLFKPTRSTTVAVALWLLFFAAIMLVNFMLPGHVVARKVSYVGTWLIAVIFLARGVGDFKYVGLFRKITSTAFASNDALIYTPLCLALSASSFLLAAFYL